jgi:hypothetical protein
MFGTALRGTKVECCSLTNGVYNIAVLDEVNNKLIIYLINKKQPFLGGIELKNFAIDTIETTSFVNGTNGNGKLIEITTKDENRNQLIL